jgi:predicted restriction endonuclease
MNQKKITRRLFRQDCFERDNYRCLVCGFQSSPEKASDELDAHHITDRNEMPNGGYVAENGISLCKLCHEYVEQNPSPDELYVRIGSSYEKALKASNN